RNLELDGFHFARAERHPAKRLELTDGSFDRRARIADVNLNDFVPRASALVVNVDRELQNVARRQNVAFETQPSDCELRVAQPEPERKLGLYAVFIEQAIAVE